jgi:hypothetical protein
LFVSRSICKRGDVWPSFGAIENQWCILFTAMIFYELSRSFNFVYALNLCLVNVKKKHSASIVTSLKSAQVHFERRPLVRAKF